MASLRFGLGLGLSAVTAGVAITVLGGAPARAQFIYGAGTDGNIYEINLTARTSSFLIPTGFTGLGQGGTGSANSLANDRVRNNLFFITPDNNLRVLQQGSGVAQLVSGATAAALGITGQLQPQNAAFYNNEFWFFSRLPAGTPPTGNPLTDNPVTLNRISFTYSGNTPSFLNRISYALTAVPNNTTGTNGINQNNFGDINIVTGGALDGRLFATTNNSGNSDGRLFRLDLAGLSTNPTTGAAQLNANYAQIDGNLGAGALQTAFDSSYTTLFANVATTGNWVTVNTTNGTLAQLSPPFTTTAPGPFPGFVDLSDSAATVRIPGPLPLLGAAAAFGWSRKLRKRINSTVKSN